MSAMIRAVYSSLIEQQLQPSTLLMHPLTYDALKHQLGGVNCELYDFEGSDGSDRPTDSSDGTVTFAVRGRG